MTMLVPRAAHAELSATERTLLDSIDTARVVSQLRRLSEDIVTTRSGAGAGTAVAGSPEERALADVIEREMRTLGLDVRREPFPVRRYAYGEVTLTADGESISAVSLHAAGGTWGSRDDVPYARGNEDRGRRVRAPLVDVGDGYAPDYARVGSVGGKAVLVHRGEEWPVYQILEAAHQGAVALLMYDYPGAPLDTIKQDSMWYHEQVPTVSISKGDAVRLQQKVARAPVEIVLENRVDSGDGRSENVIGTFIGRERPDEWITISAHYDRWWRSAQDNCVGVASMLELARVFRAAGRPRRSLMFIAFGGEEAGIEATEYDWLAGSQAFLTAHPEITRRLAFGFNFDLVGWTARKGSLHATPDVAAFQQAVVNDLGLSDRITVHPGLAALTDAWNLGTVGGGAVSYLWWLEEGEANPYMQYYHTQRDTYRAEDFGNLPVDLRIATLGVSRMDRAMALPISFTAVAAWVQQALDVDASLVSDMSFDEARAALAAFRTEVARVEGARSQLTSPSKIDPLNLWLLKVRRDLLPWLSSLNYAETHGLRKGPYASALSALNRARMAAEKSDRPAVLSALGAYYPATMAMRVSPEVFETERLYWYTSGDWRSAFEQKTRPVSSDIAGVVRRLAAGGDLSSELSHLRQLEAEVRAHLSEALFLVTGKIRAATEALREAPLR